MPLRAGIFLVLALGLVEASMAREEASAAGQVSYVGKPVAEVLEQLRARGLVLIYNSQLVPRSLRVAVEPSAVAPEDILAQILQPHGLMPARIGERAYAIVIQNTGPREDQATAPAPEAPPAQDTRPQEVTVTSSRYGLAGAAPQAHTVFTREQVDRMPRLADETLRIVHKLPGAASNGISGMARIRGGDENETGIVLNGLSLFEPFHLKNFFGPVSLLDARLLADVDVYTGGFTVDRGDRMSAVIDARTLDPPLLSEVPGREGRNYYELGVSAFHSNALASGPFDGGRGGWLAAARRSNLEEVSQFAETDYGEPSYYDGFARLTYALSPDTRLAVNFLGSRDEITAQTSRSVERSRAAYRNRYLWAEWEHESGSGLYSRLIPSITAVDNDRGGSIADPAGVTGRVYDHREFQIVGLRYDGRYEPMQFGRRLQHRWGIEARLLESGYNYSSAVRFSDGYLLPILSLPSGMRSFDRSFDLDPRGQAYGVWWSVRAQVLPRLTSEMGARWDAQTYTVAGTDAQFSPRFNALFEPSDALRLRASWGRYFQPEGIHELQVEDGVQRFFSAQRTDHLIFSVERDLPRGMQARVELYRKDYSRLRPRYENLFDVLVLLPELQFDRVRIAPDAAHVEAVEVLLSRRNERPDDLGWNWWASYALGRAADRFGGHDVARSWDQRHAVQAGLDRSGRFWNFAFTATWHSGWPTTALSSDGRAIDMGVRNGARLKDFGSLDLRVSRRFPLARGELSAYGEVTNALDRLNPCCRQYTATLDADGTVGLENKLRHWLPLVPSIGVLWRF